MHYQRMIFPELWYMVNLYCMNNDLLLTRYIYIKAYGNHQYHYIERHQYTFMGGQQLF